MPLRLGSSGTGLRVLLTLCDSTQQEHNAQPVVRIQTAFQTDPSEHAAAFPMQQEAEWHCRLT